MGNFRVNLVSQAEFSRMIGVDRSHVTRLKQAGRLVMNGKRVDAAASIARIEATKDPNRDDVVARHAAARENTAPPTAKERTGGYDYQYSRAKKESFLADQAELEFKRAAGDLVQRQDFDFVLDDFGASLRARMEILAARLAPVVFPLTTLEETHAAIEEESESVLADLSDLMARRAEELIGK